MIFIFFFFLSLSFSFFFLVFVRLTDVMANLFGECDPLPSFALGNETKDGIEHGDSDQQNGNDDNNPFPETEIDEMRLVRDLALQRQIQEKERQAELQVKMNMTSIGNTKEQNENPSSSSMNNRNSSGIEDGSSNNNENVRSSRTRDSRK
jgi:hypothetical protein